jgi:ankyrin repeat protein
VLRWLLSHGADPNTLSERRPGRECHTPLAEAAEMSTSEAVHLLVSRGAEDPEAIFYAIGLCNQDNGTSTLQALIDHGVDINYHSELWGTPLYQAVRVMDEEKMRLLLAHGADPHVKRARCGLSALELARVKNRPRWVAIIEEASGQRGP